MLKTKRHQIAAGFALASLPVMLFFQNCGQNGTIAVGANGVTTNASVTDEFVIQNSALPSQGATPSKGGSGSSIRQNGDSDESDSDGGQVQTADCRDVEISDILLRVAAVEAQSKCDDGSSQDQADFEVIDSQAIITLDKRILRIRALKSGKIKQLFVRLESEGNKVLSSNSEVFNLETPSGQQSGLKLQLRREVQISAGETYDLRVDIHADEQVVSNPAKCLLKPVIKTASLLATGP